MAEPQLPGGEDTLFRGYGPLVALVALVLAMALLAPTIAPERDVVSRERTDSSWRSSATPLAAEERHRRAGDAGEAAGR